MAFNWINTGIAVMALALSGYALYRQSGRPKIEGAVGGRDGYAFVELRNTGSVPARGAWAMISLPPAFVYGNAGVGFLGPDQGWVMATSMPLADGGLREVKGVVGCRRPGGGHLVWSLDGGRPKRLKMVTFEEGFRLFHPDVKPGFRCEMAPGKPTEW